MMISRTPWRTSSRTLCSSTGSPPTRIIGFGTQSVSGLNRVPFPAASTIAFTAQDTGATFWDVFADV